jgi:hypothetical protein
MASLTKGDSLPARQAAAALKAVRKELDDSGGLRHPLYVTTRVAVVLADLLPPEKRKAWLTACGCAHLLRGSVQGKKRGGDFTEP